MFALRTAIVTCTLFLVGICSMVPLWIFCGRYPYHFSRNCTIMHTTVPDWLCNTCMSQNDECKVWNCTHVKGPRVGISGEFNVMWFWTRDSPLTVRIDRYNTVEKAAKWNYRNFGELFYTFVIFAEKFSIFSWYIQLAPSAIEEMHLGTKLNCVDWAIGIQKQINITYGGCFTDPLVRSWI